MLSPSMHGQHDILLGNVQRETKLRDLHCIGRNATLLSLEKESGFFMDNLLPYTSCKQENVTSHDLSTYHQTVGAAFFLKIKVIQTLFLWKNDAIITH